MSRREGLVPKTITDKRGRTTTVYVRPDASGGASSIPAVKLSQPYSEARRNLDIIADCEERIQKQFKRLSSREKFVGLRSKMDADDFMMATMLVESPHAGEYMPFVLQSRINPLGNGELKEWLTVMSRHFDAVMSSGALRDTDRDEIDAAGFIGAIPRLKYLECRRRGMEFQEYRERVATEFTQEQELHLALLNAAAWNSDLESKRTSSNGQHGPTNYIEDQDLINFAFNGATREQVDTACAIMKRGGVTRFSEVEAIMDGSTTPAVAEGWL